MRTTHALAIACALSLLAACAPSADPAPGPAAAASAAQAPPAAGEPARIAWRHARTEADVAAAFELARSEGKPVLMFWGAEWCPACNQVKATLFQRQDVVERSRAFVPLSLDGDIPGAQKLAAQFKVRGYPTLVLFDAAGRELTRLPGEVDPRQYLEVLTLAMGSNRPVKAVLADALAGEPVALSDWTRLAFYAWETDEQQLVPQPQRAATLARLAKRCPPEAVNAQTRLFLKAWAADTPPHTDAAARERLLSVLRDAEASRVQMDVLSANAAQLVRALSRARTPQRQPLLDAYDASLSGLANDATLSAADRLAALTARVELAQLDAPRGTASTVSASLLADMRDHVAKADAETTDPHERQAVIPAAAYLLALAGAGDASDALLQANLARSVAPHYLMSGLAANARKRGDIAEALRWYEAAHARSTGPATRLQWGASHLAARIELTPRDVARIEATASAILQEVAEQPDAFHERSARSLQRVGASLKAWRAPGRQAALQRLQAQLEALCAPRAEADGQRACQRLLAS